MEFPYEDDSNCLWGNFDNSLTGSAPNPYAGDPGLGAHSYLRDSQSSGSYSAVSQSAQFASAERDGGLNEKGTSVVAEPGSEPALGHLALSKPPEHESISPHPTDAQSGSGQNRLTRGMLQPQIPVTRILNGTDGRIAKKRGPKADSRPAKNHRQQMNRIAQR